MSRHRFCWTNAVFGLFFLAIVGNWAAWERDLLTPRELSLTAAGVLILIGVIGAAAALWPSTPQPAPSYHPTTTTPEGAHHEEADSQQ